jgi:CRP-like cAMP-binding protein
MRGEGMEKLEKNLAEHPFLEGISADLLTTISSCATHVHYDAGEMIYREGDEADCFHLIRHGKVAIEIYRQRGSIVIQTVGPGDVLGWSWLFPPYRRRFDARAVELTRAITLDGKSLREKSEADHHLGYDLLKRFSKVVVSRLQATTFQLLDIYGKHR